MTNISIIVFVLSSVLFCHCQIMRDPHDMFEIFKDQSIEELRKGKPQPMDNESGSELPSCKQIPRSKSCSDLLDTLLQSLDQLFLTAEDDRDHDFSLRLSLTLSEIHALKHRSLHSVPEDKLCSTLQLALNREPLGTLFWNLLYGLRDLAKWTWEVLKDLMGMLMNSTGLLNNLRYQIKDNFKINFKNFVVYLWIMTFISSLFIMVKFRSVVLVLGWILICVLFVSTYSTYQRKYQVAVAEQEALLLPYKNKNMPHECSNPTKSYFTKIYESYFGAGPVEMSSACKDFYRKINVSPEVEIRISDALAETIFGFFSKIMYAVFGTADEVAAQISGKYSYWFRSWIYWTIYGMVLMFAISILLFYSGGSVTFLGLRINQSQTNAPMQIPHRQCVETVPTLHPAPPVHEVHTHIHLPANMVTLQPELSNQNRKDERIYWHAGLEESSKLSLTHRRPYRKLKSVQFLKQSTPTEANNNRRLSF